MTLDMQRMEKLGLATLMKRQYPTEVAYQIAMAARLRQITFQYLRGELQGIVADGPAVKELRQNLNALHQMDYFVRKQSANKAWATDVELTLLAELLDANLLVKMTGGRKEGTVLSRNPSEVKPTIVLCNDHNTHWSAEVKGKRKNTHPDGNCGYNSVAQCLQALVPSFLLEETEELESAAAKIIRQEEAAQLKASVTEARKSELEFDAAMQRIQIESPEKYQAMQLQIQEDYLTALALFLEDLPDEQGKTSSPMAVVAKLHEIESTKGFDAENDVTPSPRM